ncbi:beta strand repeat-containing protein [Iningainema tapete]|uniref:Filamentous hemagglutinin N-terminal domain-containing protein n=1 Tax=Iningainema tapete BLCC-T55 TaxID=2748662 RepID=A0A8J6Y234_9CYAN|nr:S-layer family protein [Iningainema tapete]MBD2778018.1 filamentous hemagglutinin N-terminal domain-containing protein [Iningainema tapete BLCC-T55]
MSGDVRIKGWLFELGIVGGAIAFSVNCALAQSNIVPDNTLGAENSTVTPNFNGEPIEVINGGTQRGQNLFHSFREFNVSAGRGAYFFSPSANIQNILARVTGGDRSEILGTLGTFGNSNPNLFLINPNGIIFGRNASLDVGGSFVATTANAIGFGNQGFFNATNPNTPELLTVNPSAFLFNQIAAASIQNNSVAPAGLDPTERVSASGLRVRDGRSLVLVGGNISMDGGRLNAFGGRVELGGVSGAGTVELGNNLNLNFSDGVERSDVSLINGAGINVIAGNGGSIAVNARNIDILGESRLLGGIGSGLGSSDSQAGNITLNATSTIRAGQGGRIQSIVEANGAGNAGNLDITTDSLIFTDGTQLVANVFGQGNAGNVTIRARDISLDGIDRNGFLSGVFTALEQGAVGRAGNISITTESLSANNGALIFASTLGQGNAGNITIDAKTIFLNGSSNGISSGVDSTVYGNAVGQAGNISITTGSLSITNGARLNTSTFGIGNVGNIKINARNAISLAGVGSNGSLSGIFNNVSLGAVGQAGNISLTSESLSASNGAQISASTFGQGNAGNVTIDANTISLNGVSSNGFSSGVYSSVGSDAIGNAGNISITTGLLSLTDGAPIYANTLGRGNAGNINVKADTISLDGIGRNGFPSGVFSSVEQGASGKGGNINITTGALALKNGARLNTSTFGQGDTGSITVKATHTISFDGVGSNGSLSGIFNNVSPGAVGEGGNISLTSETLSASNGAQIIASTFGQGNAGNITIDARDSISLRGVSSNGLFPSGVFSSVEDRQAVGKGGNISITTGSLSVTDGATLSASTIGRGDTGNINILARDNILLNGVGGNEFRSGVFNDVRSGGRGNAGNISLTTKSLSATNGARLSSITDGLGNAGNVTIDSSDIAFFDGNDTGVFSNVRNRGNGGNITITTGTLSVKNEAQLSASTFFIGNAGNINIDARNRVSIDGINTGVFSQVGARAEGRGGNVTITTGTLSVSDRAQLSATTVGRGNAGDVAINAHGVYLDGANSVVASAVERLGDRIGEGKGGNVTVTTGSLSVTNGARLIASTNAKGDAGNVTINADNLVSFDGVGSDGRSSQAITGVLSGGEGNAGDITINSGSLFITNGARLVTIAQENGSAGSVTVNARDRVSLSGISRNDRSSSISSNLASGVVGKAGDITITTGSFSATDGAFLNVSTNGKGNAGSVTINAGNTVAFNGQAYAESIVGEGAEGNAGGITISTGSLSITNRAILTTTTAGQGNAGSVRIDASDRILLSGNETGIFSRVRPEAVGTAGNITIATGSLFVTDEAQLSTSNIGQGQAGDIAVTAGSVRLDNKGTIQATTLSGNGGNLNLNVQDLLLLRRGSQISTTAGTAQAGGDGGKITINSPFIVAVPKEDSNISANAFDGNGGNVNITASGIYGIQSRPRPTSLSDITASSERGVAGTVELNTPEVDPNRGLIQLPTNLVDATQQISTACTPGSRQRKGSFTATGRGGIAPSPSEPLMSDAVLTPWVTLFDETRGEIKQNAVNVNPSNQIVEAQGWVRDANGDVVLVASVPSVIPQNPWFTPASCSD